MVKKWKEERKGKIWIKGFTRQLPHTKKWKRPELYTKYVKGHWRKKRKSK